MMEEQQSFLTEFVALVERHRQRRPTAQAAPSLKQDTALRRALRWLTPNGGTLLLVITLIATAQVWAKPLTNQAATPGPSATTVNYQGQLANIAGVPLDGIYGMTFALYDAVTGGNLIWGPEAHTAVEVSDGLFSVGLGSKTNGGIPVTTWNGDRYLEIVVDGETLSPRELIRSVPIAGMALTVPDGAITSDKLRPTMAMVSSNSEAILEEQFQTVASTTISVEVPSRLWLIATGDCETHNGGFANGRIMLDGVSRGPGIHAGVYAPGSESASLRYTVSNSYVFDLDPGLHTIDLQFSLHNGIGYVRVYSGHTGFSYLLASQ